MKLLIGIALLTLAEFVYADKLPEYQSDYVGQETRRIKSLSGEDIRQLQHGKGWGLAKAAELNGMPGPLHLLQMKNRIRLTGGQEKQIRLLYTQMKSKAVPLGRELVRLEKELNEEFAAGTITDEKLRKLLGRIADTRSRLRYVHLSAHLSTPAILTDRQLRLYNSLRGYGQGDPCAHVPEGHDAEMWKKHNGCS